jgi:hypothetical protein
MKREEKKKNQGIRASDRKRGTNAGPIRSHPVDPAAAAPAAKEGSPAAAADRHGIRASKQLICRILRKDRQKERSGGETKNPHSP